MPHTMANLSQLPLLDHGWSPPSCPWQPPEVAAAILGGLVADPPNAQTGLLKPSLPARYKGGT